MRVQELATKNFLAHLRRHPMPEILDDECLGALDSVEAQYGDKITHGAGLEVRLCEESRYIDYIMNIDEASTPEVASLWYEIDFSEFRRANETGQKILPCLFASIDFKQDDRSAWDSFLPTFLGEERAKNLRPAFDDLLERLPSGAYIRQIGTMTSRGEFDVMRLVIALNWDTLADDLAAIGWQGDGAALQIAFEPWKTGQRVGINIDLGEKGVFSKVGIEVLSRWRNPLLVDKFIARLEAAGLCLPSKAEALRRWIRIRPDGDPFIQTLITYFKLNFKDGKITEAKAYLEQSPYIHHHYFDACERPIRVELELKTGSDELPVGKAIKWLCECKANRVREVRFVGDVTHYEQLERLLKDCAANGLKSVIVLQSAAIGKLTEFATKVDEFIIELDDVESLPQGVKVRAVWRGEGSLSEAVSKAKSAGVAELIVSAPVNGQTLDENRMARIADFIRAHDDARLKISVDSCFSPLRAFMGGADPKKNANRGIERGCSAGRDHFCVTASGLVTPCRFLDMAEECDSLVAYWENSPRLSQIRSRSGCEGCRYERRCLPCPKLTDCPLRRK